jgi:hypothetical protein
MTKGILISILEKKQNIGFLDSTKVIAYCFSLILLFSCNDSQQSSDLMNKSKKESEAFESGQAIKGSNNEASSSGTIAEYNLSIKLTPFIPDYPDLGSEGKQLLATRLNTAVSKIGYGGDGANPRFIIGPSINILSKNVTSTAPTKYANTYEVSLMVCDVSSETIFETYTFEVKGVGDSPAKAFINGFRDFKFDNDDFYKFLIKSQEKIMAYYEQNCEMFMKEAEAQSKMRNFDAAFNVINNIPPEAKSCYAKIATKRAEYFQQSLNANCQDVLASMKAEMGKANDATAAGFNEPAMTYYQMIDRQSSCFKEAESVYQAYLKKLNPKAKRDWEYQMQQYQDKIKKLERDDQFSKDSSMANFDYLKHKDEMMAKAEAEGSKKLLQKYQYDELPWLRKVFHLGKYDPFDRIEK